MGPRRRYLLCALRALDITVRDKNGVVGPSKQPSIPFLPLDYYSRSVSLSPSSMAPPGKRKKKQQLDQAKKLAKKDKKINFVPLDPEAIDCDWWDTFWQRNSSLSGSLSNPIDLDFLGVSCNPPIESVYQSVVEFIARVLT